MKTEVASIDLESLDIDQLAELPATAQTEIASREKQNRKELRAELERRMAAEGYQRVIPPLSATDPNVSNCRRLG